MARPESIEDLPEGERYQGVANFQIGHIVDNPKLMRIITDLIEAVQAMGGKVHGTSYVTLDRPKTGDELEDTLRYAQSNWDSLNRRYDAIQIAELTEKPLEPEYKEYEGYALRKHAREEGYPELATIAEKPKVDA